MDSDSDFDEATLGLVDKLLNETENPTCPSGSKLDKAATGGNKIEETLLLCPDEDFGFPYESPYPIQRDFMINLFRCLASGKNGIFESPTGTGKSLSILCGALTWLEKSRIFEEQSAKDKLQKCLFEAKVLENSDDWLGDSLAKRKALVEQQNESKELLDEAEFFRKKLEDIRIRMDTRSLRAERKKSHFNAKRKTENEDLYSESENCEDFAVEDYHSDSETSCSKDEPKTSRTQLFYCSRTHSQLAQFAEEFKRTDFSKKNSCVTLGSRQAFCVNESVKKLESVSLMNERCLELQKGGKVHRITSPSQKKVSKSAGCPFYRIATISEYSDERLVEYRDVEEILQDGRKEKICPYFVSRFAAKNADLVLMPYQLLLHRPSRDACGISLKNKVVIVDEAHNLLDAISQVHSCSLTLAQVSFARELFASYEARYQTRLKAKNLLYIRQLVDLAGRLANFLSKVENDQVWAVFSLVRTCGIDNLNSFKLVKYLKKSELARNLLGFVAFMRKKEKFQSEAAYQGSSPVPALETFLFCLSNRCDDGRFVVSKGDKISENALKYILLNPGDHFRPIVKECKSVILAGGTMQPLSGLDEILIKNELKTEFFSFGHVVPREHILAGILKTGRSGEKFDFSFARRSNPQQLHDLGALIGEACQKSHGGVIVFFPSYGFENEVFQYFERKKVLESTRYRVFREPKVTKDVDRVLTGFSKAISQNLPKNGGAIIFAVVGGKLSEGINFADDLGRVVLMVGMPYPNVKSPELAEKLSFLTAKIATRSEKARFESEILANMCMKAVNQSIGRVIRHKNDFAAVLLVDSRYDRASVREKLPKWISENMKSWSCNECVNDLANFFESKKP